METVSSRYLTGDHERLIYTMKLYKALLNYSVVSFLFSFSICTIPTFILMLCVHLTHVNQSLGALVLFVAFTFCVYMLIKMFIKRQSAHHVRLGRTGLQDLQSRS